ncbi:Dyp-type peroxidase [Kribbella sp. NPDC048915]|uniref:Dyp-type peroxidase n=1 Tax=Kribbella sp. NPDC048915 TaxID=3155148 RepID=UPI0033C47E4E
MAGTGVVALGDDSPAQPAARTISPYGEHQPGIAMAAPAAAELVALKLSTDRAGLGRLMRLWTSEIVALTEAGRRLTVTVGFGLRAFELTGQRPRGLDDLPVLSHDRLQAAWSGGDLLVMVGADDTLSVVNAVRRLIAGAGPYATPVWRQTGFWDGTGPNGEPVTGRNLLGQVDGTGNPAFGTPEFDETVWSTEGRFTGGTTLVVRRIRMNLDAWDELPEAAKERVIGRRLDTGAPLTGTAEHDDLDLEARAADGRLVIPENAHARLAHPSENDGRRIFRKGLNYLHDTGTTRESGLIFLSHQADIAGQFLPILARLNAVDALNTWTTTIGSAVFALPPGFGPGGWLAEQLLS